MDGKLIGEQLAVVVREFVEKKLADSTARIASLERRLAELEGAHAKTVEAHNATVTTTNSLERRVSRHGEHLGNLETKVRMIERGTAR